jgi:hypothetical protein
VRCIACLYACRAAGLPELVTEVDEGQMKLWDEAALGGGGAIPSRCISRALGTSKRNGLSPNCFSERERRERHLESACRRHQR